MLTIPTAFAIPLPAAGNSGWHGLFPNAMFCMLFRQPSMAPNGQVPLGLGLQAALLGAMHSAAGLFSPCKDVCSAHT